MKKLEILQKLDEFESKLGSNEKIVGIFFSNDGKSAVVEMSEVKQMVL